ncbi:DUF2079 domain-containing protein [Propionibacteriaceae bacterium G1746]|uniref:DUF2079 domain-containing protein n=1 Tax=Aestuariimicrobium sp. G57 TaxID=3418485 RepID=UPI003C286601
MGGGNQRRASLHRARDVLLATGISFGTYLTVSLTLYHRFGTSYDLVIFHQAVTAMADGRAPVSELKGAHVFGDHFHPMILVLVPFVLGFPGVTTLLVAQAAALAVAAGILQQTWRDVHGDKAAWLPLLWSLSPGIMAAASYDFHEVSLGAPLVAMACRCFVRERYGAMVVWACLILLVKENAFVLTLGLALALVVRRKWLHAAVLAAVSLFYAAVVLGVVIPHFNNESEYTYGSALDLSEVGAALVRNLVWPGLATGTAVGLLALSGFSALRSPLVLAAASWWGSHLVTDNFRYQFPGFHYHLLPSVVLGFAAIIPMAPLIDRSTARRLIAAWCVLCILLGPATWRVVLTASHRPHDARTAIRMVPDNAYVAADPKLVAQLSNRTQHVTALHPPYLVNGVGRQVRPDYVVVDLSTREYGGGWAHDFVRDRLSSDYELIGSAGGYRVFRRR